MDLVKPLMPQLETTGAVPRSYLGDSIQAVPPELVKALKLAER